jgi:competence protein ComEC
MLAVKGTEQVSVRPPEGLSAARLLRWNDAIRDYLAQHLEALFPPDQSGYMKGLLIGYRADLDPQQFGEFSRLGLTHLLAVSGLHVAVFVFALLWTLRRFRMTGKRHSRPLFGCCPFTSFSPGLPHRSFAQA